MAEQLDADGAGWYRWGQKRLLGSSEFDKLTGEEQCKPHPISIYRKRNGNNGWHLHAADWERVTCVHIAAV